MSIPQPPFTPERYETYVKSLNTQDFNQEQNDVSNAWVNVQNELTSLQENSEANADRIQELQEALQIIQQKQKVLDKHQTLRELQNMYSRSSLGTVEMALAATQAAIDAIIDRNRGLQVFPVPEFELLEQEHALLEILQAEIRRRKN